MKTIALIFLATATTSVAVAQVPATQLSDDFLSTFQWRSVGPANMSGRVTDVEGIGYPSKTFFVAAAAGGIWKTTNNGTTFRLVFGPDQPVISMGDLAIAPSDTMQVWAGSGEEDSRNSISPGGGIFKSTDGGLTWEFKGLKETQVIARIRVHPTNPNRVYVAALGHIWDNNPERGLYRTDDGGETWDLIKFISDKAGFVDLVMHPDNPDVMFASSWERVRGPWYLNSGGPGSALWKTADGGDSWTEVRGNGFPETELGRIGIDIARSNPDVMYTIVEAAAPEGEDERLSGLYRSADGGDSWERMNSENTRPFYYSQVRVDPADEDRVYWSSTPVRYSIDGGRTVGQTTVGIHVDHHAMWIDPADPEHFIVGNDGGVAQTWDRGGNFDYINTIAIGQFYNISYGMDTPYTVCGGLQDNGSWCGPSRRRQGTITNAMWQFVSGGDGFVTQQDPRNPNLIYSESQGGNMSRLDIATGERTQIRKPDWRESYRLLQDSIVVMRGDTTRSVSPAVQAQLDRLQSRATADSARAILRWNWNTPFFLSPHNPDVFYAAGNKVVKSDHRGDDLRVISDDLSDGDEEKIKISTETTGGITPDNTGAETYGTIVSLAESPVREGLLYAGTDDGNVWVSEQEGVWRNVTDRFSGVPANTYVSRIEPSHHVAGRVYVTFDGHRTNDFTPYVFVSENTGGSFRSIASGLPTGNPDFVHVIREDPVNENLLFVGTDVGVHMSLDRGATWTRFMTELPTVPVHDLKIHPRDAELIAGTHGRSIWIVPILPLQQFRQDVVASDVHLFAPPVATQFEQGPPGGGAPNGLGHKVWSAPTAPYGAAISYYIRDGSRSSGDRATISILDSAGDTVTSFRGSGDTGVHTVRWNYQGPAPERIPLSPSQVRDSIRTVARRGVVVDSLREAGMEESVVGRIERLFASRARQANRRAGGGGSTAAPRIQEFNERPGENEGRERRTRPGGAAGSFGGMTMRQVLQLVSPGGSASPAGGGPGNRRAPMGPGDYTVVLSVKDQVLTTTLMVQGN